MLAPNTVQWMTWTTMLSKSLIAGGKLDYWTQTFESNMDLNIVLPSSGCYRVESMKISVNELAMFFRDALPTVGCQFVQL